MVGRQWHYEMQQIPENQRGAARGSSAMKGRGVGGREAVAEMSVDPGEIVAQFLQGW